MSEIVWQEFSKSGRITTKRKTFKTPEAADRFVTKLFEKDSFYKIIATR